MKQIAHMQDFNKFELKRGVDICLDKVVLSLEARRVQLGLKQSEISREIERRFGEPCSVQIYSMAVNGRLNTNKGDKIRRYADKILCEKEKR